jgi:hypothetical protein
MFKYFKKLFDMQFYKFTFSQDNLKRKDFFEYSINFKIKHYIL